MQSIHLALSGLALAAVVSGVAACGDTPSGPSAPTDAAIGAQSETLASSTSGSIRLRCERRSGRSRISVDASGLVPRTGSYRARVTASGGTVTSPLQRAVAGEAEFDFDSNRNDILAGATAISATFISARSGPDLVARVLDASGQVVATQGGECSFR